jgi:hypothetical protein
VTAGETLRQRSPLRFYLLVFDLSIPFWLAGAVADRLPVLPAIGEEGGWMGDAADPLQARWGAWSAWKCLETLAARVLNVGVSCSRTTGRTTTRPWPG